MFCSPFISQEEFQLEKNSVMYDRRYKNQTRRPDGKWIIKNLARKYGISTNQDKGSLIREILRYHSDEIFQERADKVGDPDLQEPISYSIKTNYKQSNFNPYSITIDINTRSFHDKLLEALYELEIYSDNEIVEFAKQLQHKMRNASTG